MLPRHCSPHELLNDQVRLSFAAATTCLVAGVIGSVVNRFQPASTTLDGFIFVGVFYSIVSVSGYLRSSLVRSKYARPASNRLCDSFNARLRDGRSERSSWECKRIELQECETDQRPVGVGLFLGRQCRQ